MLGGLLLLSGCACARTVSIDPNTKAITKSTVFIFLNKSAAENYKGLHQTKSSTTMVGFDAANTETQTDALKAIVEGAVAGAMKGVKP
jgi:hypothetical protein